MNTYYVPTTYLDGGHIVNVGGYDSTEYWLELIDSSGLREVPELDLSVALTYNSKSSLTIDVSVTLNTYVNSKPIAPDMPTGPGIGLLLTEYEYYSSTIDFDGDLMYYRWSWGDGDTSDWLGPYVSGDTCQASHSWSVSNTYQIKIQAKDTLGAESDWSYSKWAYFSGYPQIAPDQPPAPTGPDSGYMGLEYMFTGITTDANEDDIYYQWSWGDGDTSEWLGPYESGLECEGSHIWEASGLFDVMLRAKDTADNVGEWSDSKVFDVAQYVCGDGDASGGVNVSDAVLIINYIFAGGDPPIPLLSGDVDCSGGVNVSDSVWIINYIFAGGLAPCDC